MRIDFGGPLAAKPGQLLIAALIGVDAPEESFSSALGRALEGPPRVARSLTQPVLSPQLAKRATFIRLEVPPLGQAPEATVKAPQVVQPIAVPTGIAGSLAADLVEIPNANSPTGRDVVALPRPVISELVRSQLPQQRKAELPKLPILDPGLDEWLDDEPVAVVNAEPSTGDDLGESLAGDRPAPRDERSDREPAGPTQAQDRESQGRRDQRSLMGAAQGRVAQLPLPPAPTSVPLPSPGSHRSGQENRPIPLKGLPVPVAALADEALPVQAALTVPAMAGTSTGMVNVGELTQPSSAQVAQTALVDAGPIETAEAPIDPSLPSMQVAAESVEPVESNVIPTLHLIPVASEAAKPTNAPGVHLMPDAGVVGSNDGVAAGDAQAAPVPSEVVETGADPIHQTPQSVVAEPAELPSAPTVSTAQIMPAVAAEPAHDAQVVAENTDLLNGQVPLPTWNNDEAVEQENAPVAELAQSMPAAAEGANPTDARQVPPAPAVVEPGDAFTASIDRPVMVAGPAEPRGTPSAVDERTAPEATDTGGRLGPTPLQPARVFVGAAEPARAAIAQIGQPAATAESSEPVETPATESIQKLPPVTEPAIADDGPIAGIAQATPIDVEVAESDNAPIVWAPQVTPVVAGAAELASDPAVVGDIQAAPVPVDATEPSVAGAPRVILTVPEMVEPAEASMATAPLMAPVVTDATEAAIPSAPSLTPATEGAESGDEPNPQVSETVVAGPTEPSKAPIVPTVQVMPARAAEPANDAPVVAENSELPIDQAIQPAQIIVNPVEQGNERGAGVAKAAPESADIGERPNPSGAEPVRATAGTIEPVSAAIAQVSQPMAVVAEGSEPVETPATEPVQGLPPVIEPAATDDGPIAGIAQVTPIGVEAAESDNAPIVRAPQVTPVVAEAIELASDPAVVGDAQVAPVAVDATEPSVATAPRVIPIVPETVEPTEASMATAPLVAPVVTDATEAPIPSAPPLTLATEGAESGDEPNLQVSEAVVAGPTEPSNAPIAPTAQVMPARAAEPANDAQVVAGNPELPIDQAPQPSRNSAGTVEQDNTPVARIVQSMPVVAEGAHPTGAPAPHPVLTNSEAIEVTEAPAAQVPRSMPIATEGVEPVEVPVISIGHPAVVRPAESSDASGPVVTQTVPEATDIAESPDHSAPQPARVTAGTTDPAQVPTVQMSRPAAVVTEGSESLEAPITRIHQPSAVVTEGSEPVQAPTAQMSQPAAVVTEGSEPVQAPNAQMSQPAVVVTEGSEAVETTIAKASPIAPLVADVTEAINPPVPQAMPAQSGNAPTIRAPQVAPIVVQGTDSPLAPIDQVTQRSLDVPEAAIKTPVSDGLALDQVRLWRSWLAAMPAMPNAVRGAVGPIGEETAADRGFGPMVGVVTSAPGAVPAVALAGTDPNAMAPQVDTQGLHPLPSDRRPVTVPMSGRAERAREVYQRRAVAASPVADAVAVRADEHPLARAMGGRAERVAGVVEVEAGRRWVGRPVDGSEHRESLPPELRGWHLGLNLNKVGRRLDTPVMDWSNKGGSSSFPLTAGADDIPDQAAPLPPQRPADIDGDTIDTAAPALPGATVSEGGSVQQPNIETIVTEPASPGRTAPPAGLEIPDIGTDQAADEADGFADLLVEEEFSDLGAWPDDDDLADVEPDALLGALSTLAQSVPAAMPASATSTEPASEPAVEPVRRQVPVDVPLAGPMARLDARSLVGGQPEMGPVDRPSRPKTRPSRAESPLTTSGRQDKPVVETRETQASPLSSDTAKQATPLVSQHDKVGDGAGIDRPASPAAPTVPPMPSTPQTSSMPPTPATPPAPAMGTVPSPARPEALPMTPRQRREHDRQAGGLPGRRGTPNERLANAQARKTVTPAPGTPADVVRPDVLEPVAEQSIGQHDLPVAPRPLATRPSQDDRPDDRQQGRGQDSLATVSFDADKAAAGPAVPTMPFGMTPVASPSLVGAPEGQSVPSAGSAGRRGPAVAPGGVTRPDGGVGPMTERREIVGHEAVKPVAAAAPPAAPPPTPPVSPMVLTAQQVIAAVNEGVPIHFSQLPTLMEGLLSQKPIVERTVEVVLEPANLGRIKLEIAMADNGQALRLTIHTQSVAAQRVMESFLPKVQQIAHGQGYALREADVRVSDRPIRAESRHGDSPAGGRQGRRRRRGGEDATI